MASGFSGDEGKCQGLGCQASSGVTYNVKEKKKLCDRCASETESISKVRKNVSKMTCDQHDKPKKLYCKTHSLALCQLCAFTDHQKPCQVIDIDRVLREKRGKLLYSKENTTGKALLWKDHTHRLNECRNDSENHIKGITDEINSAVSDGINEIKENEVKSAKSINEEADEEIEKFTKQINEKREKRLKKCHVDAERERQTLQSRLHGLIDDVKAISKKVQTQLDDLHTEARHVLNVIDDATKRIETLLEDDEKLLNNAQQLITSLNDALERTVVEGVVEDITHTVKSVRFTRGVGKEKFNGRIERNGKWELMETVSVPDELFTPFIVGSINEDVIVTDVFEWNTYVMDLKNGTTNRVIQGDHNSFIISCVLLDGDTIVCGKYITAGCSGHDLKRCISLYDKQWKLISDISIPRNTFNHYAWVHVVVDQGGLIIAAECTQSIIYIIDPATKSIVNKIASDVNIKLHGMLSSKDIVVLTRPTSNKVLILERQGTQREIVCNKKILSCSIDPLTDDLYMVSWDERRKLAVVHHMSSSGQQEEDVFTYPINKHNISSLWETEEFLARGYFIFTKSGKLIVFNGRECILYHNTY